MLHKLQKVALVTHSCSAATEATYIHMLLPETCGIEYFVGSIVIVYIKG
jgi:hypothetical protein